ncbi:MAG TPA: hypothetical protein VIL04_11040 [Solirubrobacterales bacterium]|jgi:hypothetical protein
MQDEVLEAEAVEEESDAGAASQAVAKPAPRGLAPLSSEARAVAIAAAGGIVAGAATVVAAKAVAKGSGRKRRSIRLGRRDRREVVASRSFLVDVHLLGR